MNVRFLCPSCESHGGVDVPAREPWRCPSCDHVLVLGEPSVTNAEQGLTVHSCVACGNAELYKMKGFPHWLGMSILVLAIAGFLVLNWLRLQWWAWGVLLASAAIDGGLYLLVKDVVVCYRCGGVHSGIGRSGNSPFELTIAERYRQERIRLETVRRQTPSA